MLDVINVVVSWRFVYSSVTTFSCVDARGDASMLVSGVI
jgi:hypothetical protein